MCKELKDEYGIDCSYIIADFTKLSDVHSAAKKLAELDRKIDVLIHNAAPSHQIEYITMMWTLKTLEWNIFQSHLNYLTLDETTLIRFLVDFLW